MRGDMATWQTRGRHQGDTRETPRPTWCPHKAAGADTKSKLHTLTPDVHINMSDGRPASGYVDPRLRATYTLKCMLARGFTTVRDVVSLEVWGVVVQSRHCGGGYPTSRSRSLAVEKSGAGYSAPCEAGAVT